MKEAKSFDDRLGNDVDLLYRRLELVYGRLRRIESVSEVLKDFGSIYGELVGSYTTEAIDHLGTVEISAKSLRENAKQRLRSMSHDLDEFIMVQHMKQKQAGQEDPESENELFEWMPE